MVHHPHTISKKRRGYFLKHLHNLILLGFAGVFFILGTVLLLGATINLPDFESLSQRKIVESTKIYDRTGKILLYDIHDDVKRTLIPFDQISLNVKKATIAVEDSEFYTHHGIKITSIVRAFIANVFGGGYKQGGSTITQQVIKKTLLTDDKLITRKIKEIILSLKLEREFSKDEILALYLNEVPYGGNVYGIKEASNQFFGIEPRDLTLAQGAYLASLPNAPTYYSPYGNHRDALDDRKNFVLKRAYDLGFITEQEYNDALAEKVTFLPREPQGIKAPHFVMWVKEYLEKKYGERAIEESGYKIITTLDYTLQQKGEEIIAKYGDSNEEKYGVKNMGLVAIDPKTGQVLTMIGSRDYFNAENNGNFNVTLAPNRQPGSTLKPFVYAAAFMKGYTPETVLFDLRTNFSTNCDPYGNPLVAGITSDDCYTPQNYDGKYRGPVSIRNSLAGSLNIPAVKTLYLVGINNAINTLRNVGITSLNDPERYGLTLVLGGGEVSLLELTGAYGTLANEGVRNPITPILRIEDKRGNVVEEFRENPQEAIPAEVARKVSDILSDNVARTPIFGAHSSLYFPNNQVAAKTGTTNDFRDAWAMGYTPNIAVGMWGGNNDNKPVQKDFTGIIISPAWHAFMEEALKHTPNELFTPPEKEDLSKLPTPLAGIWQGGEEYKTNQIPDIHSILYWVDKDNPRGSRPSNPQNDAQFNLWETPVRDWALKQNLTPIIPSNTSPVGVVALSVLGFDFNTPHSKNEILTITVTNANPSPLSKVELSINNVLIGQKAESPFSFSIPLQNIQNLSENNILTVTGYDTLLNKGVHQNTLIIK